MMQLPFRRSEIRHISLLFALVFFLWLPPASASQANQIVQDMQGLGFPRTLHRLIAQNQGANGVYVLDKGEEAMLARAWMVTGAKESIDILTFIWTLDNIGRIGTEALLSAAERGVRVRVVVDDMLLDEEPMDILLALAAHPNIAIKVYNPVMSVGVNKFELVLNFLTKFRLFNHRMHNKTFLADQVVGICGGRNVANEYFDYDQNYNFRDRDILVIGPVVHQMKQNFERYWQSDLAHPIAELLPRRMADLSEERIQQIYHELHQFSRTHIQQLPLVQRALANAHRRLAEVLTSLTWTQEVEFVSDLPGKNLNKPGLGGGGRMEEALTEAIASAKERITIQSPYMVLPEGAMGLFEKRREGVEIRISTNSLASTDNVAAFSGYVNVRDDLLKAGMIVREFRPNPAIEKDLIERYLGPEKKSPIFVLHAKTLVIDGKLLYVGTFNIDPRSANLNTEEGIFVRDAELARSVEEEIEREMQPQNSWNPRVENTDAYASLWRRMKLTFFRILPLRPVL